MSWWTRAAWLLVKSCSTLVIFMAESLGARISHQSRGEYRKNVAHFEEEQDD